MDSERLATIRKLEDQYGSLVNVPTDNPDLLKLNKSFGKGMVKRSSKRISANQEKRVVDLVTAGYPQSYVLTRVNIDVYLFHKVIAKYDLETRPAFKYMLRKKGKIVIYAANISGISYAFFGLNKLNRAQLLPKLKANHYELLKSYHLWKSIPENSLYLAANGHLYTKHGIKSYKSYPAEFTFLL